MSDDDLPPTHRPWGSGDNAPQQPAQQPPNPYQPPANPYPQPGSFDQYAAPNPYGMPPYPGYQQGYGAGLPEHPSATTALVLGIVGLVGIALCGGLTLVLSPFAWAIGGRSVKEIDAAPGRYSGRDKANAGRIMGIIGTVLLVLGVVAVIGLLALAFALVPGHVDNTPTPAHQHHAFLHS
ncbi:MAG: DUF4190 domain-containing protein [Nocardioides sp.]